MLAGTFAVAAPTTALIVLQTQVAGAYGVGGEGFSALALSLLGLAATLPTLVAAVFSGTFADRYDRRGILKIVGFIALAATAGIALVLAADPRAAISAPGPAGFTIPLWLLLTFPIWAAITAAVTIFRPTFNATLPRMVETKSLGAANGLFYAMSVAVSSATVILTGLIADHAGPVSALSVPILLFALSLLFLFLLGPDPAPPRTSPRRSFLADAQEGYRYLLRRRELLALTLGSLAINFLSALAFVELAQYSTFTLGQSTSFLGYLYGVGTLGAGAGALVIHRLPFERYLGRVLGILTVGMGACVTGFALTRSAPVALVDMFLFGMFPGMIQTAFIAGVQATVPNDVLGRVFAADEVGSYAFVPVGQYSGGLLTYFWGIEATYLGAGIGMGLVGAMLFVSPTVAKFRYEPEAGALRDPGPPAPPPGAEAVRPEPPGAYP